MAPRMAAAQAVGQSPAPPVTPTSSPSPTRTATTTAPQAAPKQQGASARAPAKGVPATMQSSRKRGFFIAETTRVGRLAACSANRLELNFARSTPPHARTCTATAASYVLIKIITCHAVDSDRHASCRRAFVPFSGVVASKSEKIKSCLNVTYPFQNKTLSHNQWPTLCDPATLFSNQN